MSMKKFISLFLMCFLVIATLGVGTSQANVIEKDAIYIDVGVEAGVNAVAFENVAVATQAEINVRVCISTIVVGCFPKAVAPIAIGAKIVLPMETRLFVYKVPWRFNRTNIYYAKTFGNLRNGNHKNPRDGLVTEAFS